MTTNRTSIQTEERNEMKDSKKILKMMDQMNDRMDRMSDRMDQMNDRMDQMDEKITRVESKTTEIQLTLENEIRRDIMIVAEGHLDLNRKLDEALKIDHEKELMLVRMNHLETQVREIKNKIEETA